MSVFAHTQDMAEEDLLRELGLVRVQQGLARQRNGEAAAAMALYAGVLRTR